MYAGTKNLSAVIALLSVAYASGQCVSTSYGQWIPCGSSSPKSCDQAYIYFNIRRATNVSGRVRASLSDILCKLSVA